MTRSLTSLPSKVPTSRTKPFDADVSRAILKHWHEAVPNDRLAHLIKDASRAFLRALQIRLAKHDVPLGIWTFLRILWERDGVTQRELSLAAGVMEPTTVTALRAMESRGYIMREQKPGNRKNVYIFLTPTGRRLESRLIPLAEEVNAIAVDGIDPDDVATTRRALLAMIGNLARDEIALEAEQLQPAPPKRGKGRASGGTKRAAAAPPEARQNSKNSQLRPLAEGRDTN